MTATVLIIEGMDELRAGLVALAQRELSASAVYQADSVTAALQLIDRHSISLALIDLGLLDGSGIEVIRTLKRQQPECRCVVTTISDDSDNLFNALHVGADGYVLKDEPEAKLIKILCGILERRPPLSAAVAKKVLKQSRPVRAASSVLTAREEELLALIACGHSVPKASEAMGISAHTGAGYLKQIYQKLQVSNRAEATIKAIKLGLIKIDG